MKQRRDTYTDTEVWRLFPHTGEETQWWSCYTSHNTHILYRRHIKDTDVNINWTGNQKKPQMFRPCFSPSPPPVEVQFILQFIYTYIVSMHKRIPRPNRNDRGAVVGSLFSFSSSFFYMGITLTHIGDNLQTQKLSQKKVMQNRNECPSRVRFKGALRSFDQKRTICFTSEHKWINKLSLFSRLNKQTDLKGQHTVLLCLYVADPATCLASNSVLGTLFPTKTSLFIQLWKKYIYFWVCLNNSLIL